MLTLIIQVRKKTPWVRVGVIKNIHSPNIFEGRVSRVCHMESEKREIKDDFSVFGLSNWENELSHDGMGKNGGTYFIGRNRTWLWTCQSSLPQQRFWVGWCCQCMLCSRAEPRWVTQNWELWAYRWYLSHEIRWGYTRDFQWSRGPLKIEGWPWRPPWGQRDKKDPF